MALEYKLSFAEQQAAEEFTQSRPGAENNAFHIPQEPVTDAEIERNLAEMNREDQDKAVFAPMPSNVTPIREGIRVNSGAASEVSPTQAAKETVVEEVGEVIAAEALHPIEVAQKTNEFLDRLASNPAAFQTTAIDMVNFMSTPGLDAGDKDRLASILLQELQNSDRPIDIESINPYLDALAHMKNEESDLWQSTLKSEGERVIMAKYDHIRNNRNVSPQTQNNAEHVDALPARDSETTAAPSTTQLKTVLELAEEGPLTARVAAEKQAAQEAEVAEATPIAVQPAAEAQATLATDVEQQPMEENNAENERLEAEIKAEDAKYRVLVHDLQGAWRELQHESPSSQRSIAFDNVPQNAGFLDIRAFVSQLEGRMDNSQLRANQQFAGLTGGGLEVALARKQRVNLELEHLLNLIKQAKLTSPEMEKDAAEAVRRAKRAEYIEKWQTKLKEIAGLPQALKADPHAQKNPYFNRYGRNELGMAK